MQALGLATVELLKASVQCPKAKLEIWYGGVWVDLTNLNGNNYLKSFSVSFGGASMTTDPVAGTWSALISSPDGIFYPENTASAYCAFFITSRKVRISVGGTYGGSDVYWQRMIGVMDSPRFQATIGGDVEIQGMDYFQYLSDYKLRKPSNYWGTSALISTLDPTESLGAEIYAELDASEIGAGEANTVASWSVPAEITLTSQADGGGGSTYVMKAVIVAASAATSETLAAAGAQTWLCPAGVASVDVEVWGAGAGGGGSTSSSVGGGGGGGGAYSKKTAITVTPGATYAVMVGAAGVGSPGGDGTDGGDSYFIDPVTVMAKGGGRGTAGSGLSAGDGGHAGLATEGVGDTRLYGGGGGDAEDAGGGGGSSSGTAANGGTGGAASGTTPGSGGSAPSGGGDGGNGGAVEDDGHDPASGAGGGGGGSGRRSGSNLFGGDGKPGKVIISYTAVGSFSASITNTDIGSVTAGTKYKVTFKHKLVSGTATMVAGVYVGSTRQGEVTGLAAADYEAATFYFVASDTGAAKMIFTLSVPSGTAEFRIDQISMKPVAAIGILPRYALPDGCTGVYYATLNGSPIWYGVDPNGWYYDADHNEFYFSPNTNVVAGTDNLVVYYHTAQIPLYVVADILVLVGLYATRAAALTAMTYTETGPSIDRVWFEAGTTALNAIKMICERCNLRFYFKWDGGPALLPDPAIKAVGSEDFAFEEPHVINPVCYEDRGEIFNYISVEGEQRAQPVGLDQTMASNYRGVDSDAGSISTYGDRTKSISNHLFQSDAACAAMATELLALYLNPRKYLDFSVAFLAAPIEIGDTVRVQVRLSALAEYGALYDTFLYDDGTKYGYAGIILVLRGRVRDIKIDNYAAKYIVELATSAAPLSP
jgi:hypothetical protein